MKDADRYEQIESLTTLKRVLDATDADDSEVRDAAIRVVNQFDASIAAHDHWSPYSRRGSNDPDIRSEAAELGKCGVERHHLYRSRLRRLTNGTMAEIRIIETTEGWKLTLRHKSSWQDIGSTTESRLDGEMIGARHLVSL